jgi:hypothetical protein
MCCPFAKRCPRFEAFAREGSQHLAWAFCLGEYRDCDDYKRTVAGDAVPEGGEAGGGGHLEAEKERILARLRSSLLDPRARS